MSKKFRPKALISLGSLFVAVPILLFGFQNCAKFAISDSLSKLSASCSAKIQEQAPAIAKLLSATALDCESPENYKCLVRTFSPNVENATHESIACLAGDSKTCVQTTAISFDTKSARNSNYDAKDFSLGGDYNRVEAQCSHTIRYAGAALFIGLGDDLESAFASAKLKCVASNTSLASGGAQ
ncbi:hypothetical protein BH10BDE1_BH10BDE1_19280 [soil metagenome]